MSCGAGFNIATTGSGSGPGTARRSAGGLGHRPPQPAGSRSCAEGAQVMRADPGRRPCLLDGESTLAALGSKGLTQSHSRPKRSRRSSTSGKVISTSRDLEPW